MESNPSYDSKPDDEPKLSEEDLKTAASDALNLVGQVTNLLSLIKEDETFVDCSSEQRASLEFLNNNLSAMWDSQQNGSIAFEDKSSRSSFAGPWTKLATSSPDMICEGGVSFEDLNLFINASFYHDNATIIGRITEKSQAAKQAKEAAAAAAEAARKAEEAEALA